MPRGPVLWLVLLAAFPVTLRAQPNSQSGGAPPLVLPEHQVVGRSPLAPKVVLVGTGGAQQPGLVGRLRAELATLDLELVTVQGRAATLQGRLAELGAQASAEGAVAAVRVETEAGRRRIALWLYDAVTGKMLFRDAALQRVSGVSSPASISLQAVELIHASLLELNLPSQRRKLRRRPLPAPVARVVRALSRKDVCPEPQEPPFSLGLGPALAATVGGAGLTAGLWLAVSWHALSWLDVALESFVPLVPATAQAPDGSRASLASLSARLGVRVEAWRWRSLALALSTGLGALVGYASGDSDELYLGRTDWGVVPAAALGLDLRWRLSRRLALLAGASADVALYSLSVTVAGQQRARIGPLVLGSRLALVAALGE